MFPPAPAHGPGPHFSHFGTVPGDAVGFHVGSIPIPTELSKPRANYKGNSHFKGLIPAKIKSNLSSLSAFFFFNLAFQQFLTWERKQRLCLSLPCRIMCHLNLFIRMVLKYLLLYLQVFQHAWNWKQRDCDSFSLISASESLLARFMNAGFKMVEALHWQQRWNG